MSLEGDHPVIAEQPRGVPRTSYFGDRAPYRDRWGWIQLIGLGLLAAGVLVLVFFALTVGGR